MINILYYFMLWWNHKTSNTS